MSNVKKLRRKNEAQNQIKRMDLRTQIWDKSSPKISTFKFRGHEKLQTNANKPLLKNAYLPFLSLTKWQISQFHPVVLMFSLCTCRWLAWCLWHVSVVSLMPSWRRVSGSTHSHPGHLGWWHFSAVHGEHTYCIHTLARALNAGLCACDNRHCHSSLAHSASHFPSHTMTKHTYTLRHANTQANTFLDSHKHQHTQVCRIFTSLYGQLDMWLRLALKDYKAKIFSIK